MSFQGGAQPFISQHGKPLFRYLALLCNRAFVFIPQNFQACKRFSSTILLLLSLRLLHINYYEIVQFISSARTRPFVSSGHDVFLHPTTLGRATEQLDWLVTLGTTDRTRAGRVYFGYLCYCVSI